MINGSVLAHSVVVLGTVKGNISAEYIEIRESAHVSGDVSYVRMEIHQGSHVEGRMFRIEGGAPAAAPDPLTDSVATS